MFIEVTNYDSGEKEIINVNHIVRISKDSYDDEKLRILLDIKDDFNDCGEDNHLMVEESYEDVKKMMKKIKATVNVINRFELMDLEE